MIKRLFFLLILPVTILFAWHIATTIGNVSPIVLPNIKNTLLSFQQQLISGQLFNDLSISLFRVLVAFCIATVLGIIFGFLMGMYLRINHFFNLTLNAIRQIPPLAWIPLLILWFGIGESTKIIMIVKSAFFPIFLNTMGAVQNIPQNFIELGRLYQLSFYKLLTKIYIPSILPSLFVGLRLAMGLSWATVVAAEMIASDSGIGYRINDARIMLDSPVIIVGIISIGVIGILLDCFLLFLSKSLLPWHDSERG